MVKIRLTRIGRKGNPSYRIIAIQAREKRDSRAIEYLGTYNPKMKPSTYKIDKKRIEYWLSVGAQPTPTVSHLLAKEGLIKIEKKKFSKTPGKKKAERSAKAEPAEKNENKPAEQIQEVAQKEDKKTEPKEERKEKPEETEEAKKVEDTQDNTQNTKTKEKK